MTAKQLAIFGTVLLLAIVAGWWFQREDERPAKPSPKIVRENLNRPEQVSSPTLQTEDMSVNDDKPEKLPPDLDPSLWWKAPISFYGKVVDEKEQPVGVANIRITWTDQSPTGQSETQMQSDAGGLFSIKGIRGYQLGVYVSKEGYYTSPTENKYFRFAGIQETFIPDSNKPVVFRLKKKGEASELVKKSKSFLIPKDGTPVEISLLTGKVVPSGQGDIKVECWTIDQDFEPTQPQPYDWRFRLSVPGGGLIETTEEFPSEAPLEGYKSLIEINMPASLGSSWSRSVENQYYLKLRDGNYARIFFNMMAYGNHGCRIESYLNPDKSRNLEYDRSKEIEVKRM